MVMAASLMFLSGCASEWLVDISTRRIEVEVPSSNGLTATSAFTIFNDVARQFGLEIHGPVPQPIGNESVIEYNAIFQRNGTERSNVYLGLDLFVTKSAVIIYCRSDKSAADAQRVALSVERALDEHGVRYNVSTRTGGVFN